VSQGSSRVEKRTYQFEQSRLTLQFGDITTSDAEILVSSDDFYLTMSGGVSAAIRAAGGNSIPLDAAKHVPAPISSVIVTTAGSLPAKYIFHAITIDPRFRGKSPPKPVIAAVTDRCLKLLEALRANSIAFPAIGTGTAGFNYEDVAVQMAEVVADDLLNRKQPIEVTIYLYDRFGRMQPMDFLRFFEEFAARAPRVAKRETANPSAGSGPGRAIDSVFISYSHKDKVWLEKLQTMLKPLVRKQELSIWDDTAIQPGARWKEEIEKALASTNVAVLLVTKDFLNSAFIEKNELPPLLNAAGTRGLKILWIPVGACLYQETEIGDYQAAHDPARPLMSLTTEAEQDEALVRICQQIKVAVTTTRTPSPSDRDG
jgi:O-acetyl-ADP-ribose deacetylase (regulator of RNase III)